MSSGSIWVNRCSLKLPMRPPSALVPLSDTSITMVSSSSPMSSRCVSTRPICASVCERKPANTSCSCANRRRCASGSSAQSCTQLGRSVSTVRSGTIPSSCCRANVRPPRLPAVVEPAPVGLDPFGRDVVRRVHRAGREVEEERAIRRGVLLVLHVPDGGVGQVFGEVVPLGGGARRIDVVVVAHEVGCPVVGVTLEEAVVPLEAEAERPPVEGARVRALPRGHEVPLADRHRVVPGVAQQPRHGDGRSRDAPGVARVRHRRVGEVPHSDRVMVATGEEARASVSTSR